MLTDRLSVNQDTIIKIETNLGFMVRDSATKFPGRLLGMSLMKRICALHRTLSQISSIAWWQRDRVFIRRSGTRRGLALPPPKAGALHWAVLGRSCQPSSGCAAFHCARTVAPLFERGGITLVGLQVPPPPRSQVNGAGGMPPAPLP